MTLHVNAAKFIARELDEPYEELLGGGQAHHVLNEAHADWCTEPGHQINWHDCYAAADMLPIPQKAHLFLDFRGQPLPVPEHLTGEKRASVEHVTREAARIVREAHRLGVDR